MKLKICLTFFLVLGLLVACLFHFFEFENKSNHDEMAESTGWENQFVPPTLVSPATTPFQDDNLGKAYQSGYEKGYYAFLIQNEQDPKKISAYTSSVEDVFNDQNSEDYKEAVEKGYVDGYHKACDSVHCPSPRQIITHF